MSRFKFRVWSKSTNSWKTNLLINNNGTLVWNDGWGITSIGEPKDFIIQQFIGISDSKGIDIYEGDIVKWCHPMEDIGVVEYFAYNSFNPNITFFGLEVKRLGACQFQSDDDYEVIGNIFKNPELLEK